MEIISIHIGKEGCKCGEELWKLRNREHLLYMSQQVSYYGNYYENVHYSTNSQMELTPRCLYFPEVRSRGEIVEEIRMKLEGAEKVEGVLINLCNKESDVGMWEIISRYIEEQAPKILQHNFALFQSLNQEMNYIEVEEKKCPEYYEGINKGSRAYINQISHSNNSIVNLFDRYSERHILQRLSLDLHNVENICNLWAHQIFTITNSYSLETSLNTGIPELRSHLIPPGRSLMRFVLSSYAPIGSRLPEIRYPGENLRDIVRITYQAFTYSQSESNWSLPINPYLGKVIGLTINWFGSVIPKYANHGFIVCKNTKLLTFAENPLLGLKVGINYVNIPAIFDGEFICEGEIDESCLFLMSNTQIGEYFEQFDDLQELEGDQNLEGFRECIQQYKDCQISN